MRRSLGRPGVFTLVLVFALMLAWFLLPSRTDAVPVHKGGHPNPPPTHRKGPPVPKKTVVPPTRTPIPTRTPRPTPTALPSTLTVTSTLDPSKCLVGPGQPGFSLRCAIVGADKSGVAHTIVFAIPSNDPNCRQPVGGGHVACTIAVSHALPPLIVSDTMIDGFTETGAQRNTAPPPAAATPTPGPSMTAGTTPAGSPIATAKPGTTLTTIATIKPGATAGATATAPPATPSTTSPAPTATAPSAATPIPTATASFPPKGNAKTLLAGGVNSIITIQVDGSGASGNGLQIRSAAGDTIRGVSITDFSSGAGIGLLNAPGATVTGNLIGITPSGASHGNGVGVLVKGSDAAVVGGTNPADVNVISGNYSAGIQIKGGNGTVIQGNLIGTSLNATTAVGNRSGIEVAGNDNSIGGTGATAGNVISGNTGNAVTIHPGNSNVIQGNVMGTTADGMSKLPNHGGIVISGNGNTIGGTGSAGNVVSANAVDGITIHPGSGNVIQGNVIGATADGLTALGNRNGLTLSGSDNKVGGPGDAANVISGNSANGLSIAGGSGNLVDSNLIGVSENGSPLGNKGNGVAAGGDSGDVITSNVIANNGQVGIFLNPGSKGSRTNVAITRNSLFSNRGFGIRFATVKTLTCFKQHGAGANDNTACPVIDSVTSTRVSGTACTDCTVEVYVATDEVADHGYGEGKTFLGATTATNGKWSLSLRGHSLNLSKQKLTATATTPATQTVPSETSEFSFNMPVAANVDKFGFKSITVKKVKITYTTGTRKKTKHIKSGCLTIAHLPVCNESIKVVVTHYKVPHRVVTHIQVAIIFEWHAAQQDAIGGFVLYAGKQRLNKALIRVHKNKVYRARVPLKRTAKYTLVMVLKNGVPIQISPH